VRRAWVAVLSFSCRGASEAEAPPSEPRLQERVVAVPAAPDPAPTPVVRTDWCTAGLVALDEETCYALPPPSNGRPTRVLVYLHGIVPPVASSPQKENVMSSVLRASMRAGAAAIVPRGIRGVGPSGAKDWWAWPTSPRKHAELAPAIALRIGSAKKKLEEIVGAPFARTYLAGSSNGAYFATALALRGEIDVDALGAMSGGSASPIMRKRPLPVYVGFGTYDEATKRGARALARAAEAVGWKTKLAEHPFGHGAREVYLDEAFAFWDAAVVP
jgi:predicted esterase